MKKKDLLTRRYSWGITGFAYYGIGAVKCRLHQVMSHNKLVVNWFTYGICICSVWNKKYSFYSDRFRQNWVRYVVVHILTEYSNYSMHIWIRI